MFTDACYTYTLHVLNQNEEHGKETLKWIEELPILILNSLLSLLHKICKLNAVT